LKDTEVVALKRRMRQLEEERRREERLEQLGLTRATGKEISNGKDRGGEVSNDNFEGEKEARTKQRKRKSEKGEENPKTDTSVKKNQQKKVKPMRMSKKEIEREIGLRERDLESRRKQNLAEKIVLPFTLKKVMVEEWEIISQCAMVPNLPASVTVKDALSKYLESKIDMLRLKQKGPTAGIEAENQNKGKKHHIQNKVDSGDGKHIDNDMNGDFENEKQEWVDMVDGLSLYFDQALPTRLLFKQEIGQHTAMMRSSSKDTNLEGKCMSEIYGCEHLLRLFIRLPALIDESGLPEMETRKIYAKIGDLVRFLQKEQAELFTQSYRKLRHNEIVIKQNVSRGRKRKNAGKRGEEEEINTRMKKKGSYSSSDKDTAESDGSQSESIEIETNRDDNSNKKKSEKKPKSTPKNLSQCDGTTSRTKKRTKKDSLACVSTEQEEKGRRKRKAASTVAVIRTIDRRRAKKVCASLDSTSIKVSHSNKKPRKVTSLPTEIDL